MTTQILQVQGTTKTWLNTGGDETLTLTSVGNSAGRKGTSCDWGASFPQRLRVQLKTSCGSSPTAGNTIEVWWASSYDGSVFDGNLADADAAASDTDVIAQLHFVGALPVDNVTTIQYGSWVFMNPSRYGFPVVFNRSGQTLGSTASDHGIYITPLIDEIQA